jgi:serine phosphatase RsbU (regulator of sigma subunit)
MSLRAKPLADLILEGVNQFADQAMQHDDLTFILLKVC